MQIDSLTVHNYRCIGKLKLDRLTPITILVGRNNTGKSALLEALALVATAETGWYDSLGEDLLEPILERRGGWEHVDMMIKVGEPHTKIYATGEFISGTVTISRLIDDIPSDVSSRMLSNINEHINTIFEKYLEKYVEKRPPVLKDDALGIPRMEDIRLDIKHAKKSIFTDIWNQIHAYVVYNDKRHRKSEYALLIGKQFDQELKSAFHSIGEKYELPYRTPPSKQIFRSHTQKKGNTLFLLNLSFEYLRELQSRLARSGDLIDLITFIRERIPYFKDLREVKNQFFVYLEGLKSPIPLETMGDGFRAQMTILAAIMSTKNGVALLEEPEVRLHPGYMSVIADHIGKTATRSELQYIISTHSADFLEFLIEDYPELTKVVRMYRSEYDAEIDYEVIDGNDALDELANLKMDLRGV